jgi:sugar phosphate isomerase/epimerase
VGYGCQNFPAILEAAEESGAKWIIVEQDLSLTRPALEAARMSIDYLKSIGAVE